MRNTLTPCELDYDVHNQEEIAHHPCFISFLEQKLGREPDENEALMLFINDYNGGYVYREEESIVKSPLNLFAAGKFFRHDPNRKEATLYLILWRNGAIDQEEVDRDCGVL
ncbi:hypothetical protein ACFL0K_02700 [Patescibacteria group bacterium]